MQHKEKSLQASGNYRMIQPLHAKRQRDSVIVKPNSAASSSGSAGNAAASTAALMRSSQQIIKMKYVVFSIRVGGVAGCAHTGACLQ